MFRNAFAYITRKWSKSLLLLTIILLMSTLSLLGLAMRSATQEAASKSLGAITNSFSMQINRNTNPGTPRGAGNLKGEDIKKRELYTSLHHQQHIVFMRISKKTISVLKSYAFYIIVGNFQGQFFHLKTTV